MKDSTSAARATSRVSCESEGASFSVSIKMRQLAEEHKALVNFFARQCLQPFRAKPLHGKRPHHAAIEHRSLERARSDFFLRRQIAEESAGKRIAGPGRIDDFAE